MSPESIIQNAIAPALRLLPSAMNSDAAIAELVAIGLQESRLKYRRQIHGPARGYWQFEQGGGVRGVLTNPETKPHIQSVLEALDYDPEADAGECWVAIEHNDILAAAFARLLLWSLPQPLAARNAPEAAWGQYIAAWRPGKPHRDTWNAFFSEAWDLAALA